MILNIAYACICAVDSVNMFLLLMLLSKPFAAQDSNVQGTSRDRGQIST